jgi:sodium transport system permease protein
MPLLMVTMPLIILPMAPNTELNLGNCLLPITGIVLLLRSFLEGNYQGTLPYIFLVSGVTLGCCVLAIRWAIDQFNSESVLFRESEQFHLGLWIHRMVQDRHPTPTLPMAFFLGLLILIIKFFISFSMPAPDSYRRFVEIAIVTQMVVIAFPAILSTMLLTSSARQTLKLKRPPLWTLPAVALLALVIHPFTHQLQKWVMQLYPVSDQVMRSVAGIQQMITEAPLPSLLLVIAVLPAVCEELAFRGFMLSGLRHMGSKWRAIFITAIFFGLTHPILQQSLLAILLGVMIGYLTVQSGSIWPAMLYHMCHNGLNALSTRIPARWIEEYPAVAQWLGDPEKSTTPLLYQWPVILVGLAIAAALLYAFGRIPSKNSPEENDQKRVGQKE